MYEYIRGIVTNINPYYIVIETAGIGYQIAVANPFRYAAEEGQESQLYLYQAVREDSLTLYGFANLEEKQLFSKLISVSGIGPKSGLAIMAGEDHAGLVKAIESEDVTYLTRFPGVGKKTAQQMILDLKGKLAEIALGELTALDDVTVSTKPTTQTNRPLDEALAALNALGYSERELKRISKELEAFETDSTDGYLRHGLKLIMKK